MREWLCQSHSAGTRYGVAAAAVVLSTAICWGLKQAVSHEIAFMVFIPAVLLATWCGGVGPGIAAMIAGALLGDHFMLAPPGSKDDHGPVEISILAAYCISSISCTGLVTSLSRQHKRAQAHARKQEQEADERRRAEEAALRHNATLAGVNRVLKAALTCQTEEELGMVCLEVAEKITQSKLGFIGEIHDNRVDAIAINNPGGEACNIIDPAGHGRPIRSFTLHGIYGHVLRDGKSLLTNDPTNYPDHIGLPTGHPPLKSFLGVPLVHEGQTTGTISVANREGGYTQAQQEALEALAPAVVEAFMRKRAEEAVQRTNQLLGAILNHTPMLVACFDRNFNFVQVNSAYAAVDGKTPEFFRGKNHFDLYPNAENEEIFREVRDSGRPYFVRAKPFEYAHTPERGVSYWDWSLIPIADESGRVQLLVMTLADVTPIKRTEVELRRAKEQAEAANTAKDRFIATLSHELRTPLTPALAATRMLARDRSLPESAREDLTMVSRNISLEARLIDDLLEITHIATGKLLLREERTDVAEILREVIRMCTPEMEDKGLRLSVEMAQASYPMIADATRLHQVFWNLLRNAIKFTPQGGTIAVRCSCITRENGKWLIATVRDSGMGIEADVLPRLFRPFEQGQRVISDTFGGLGLGLSIAKAVVEMHGGRIRAESNGSGQGATFTVELPLAAAMSSSSRDERGNELLTSATPTGIKPLRVLLVEDHADTAKLIGRLLAAEGHQVVTAGGVTPALAATQASEFDAMVCDLGLPDGSGHDLMRNLVAQGKAIRG
ncbi:MAG: ATP-binding protein, partial [Bacillota bacterium]